MNRINRNPLPSQQTPDAPAQTNQHHAIQYSSQFVPDDASKPVPLAHFMGARRDLKGPILTKQRVDEKEIRPEGWELAEKRSQLAQTTHGISSLASFLSGASTSDQMSSHAANLSKRALPGMTPSNKSPLLPFSDQPKTNTDLSKQANPPISHAASYLKPKTLADRLAQLGVSQDVQSIKPNLLPPQQANTEHDSRLVQSDLSRNVNRIITKSTSANSVSLTNLPLEESPQEGQPRHRPLSVQVLPTRGGLPAIPSPRNANLPQISTTHDLSHLDSPITRPVDTAPPQPTGGPSYKKNNRPHSALVLQPSSESVSNLSVPSKSMTASLSRLAGSNIVAQRLQWSKEKEQLGTMDEFGNPVVKTSPNPNSPNLQAQIPLPSGGLNDNAPSTAAVKNSASHPTGRVFFERNRNSNHESCGETNSSHRPNPSPRLPVPHKIEHQHCRVNLSDDPMTKTNINQFNRSIKRSDEDDALDSNSTSSNSYRDNKRNKKNENQILESPVKTNHKKESSQSDRSVIKTKQDILLPSLNSPTSSPRFPSTKLRNTRSSHRQSSSVGSTHTSSVVKDKNSPPKNQKILSPATSSARQLPSIPSFSPMMKKGTSELAAIWGTRLTNAKNPQIESQAPMSPTTHQNIRPPLPILPHRPNTLTGDTVDGRPLPVPPSGSLNLNLGSEHRSKSRPLPVPQAKSSESSLHNTLEDKSKTGSFHPYGNTIDGSDIWARYKDQQQFFLPESSLPNEQVDVEIFQLNQTESNEFSKTTLDPEEYPLFFSQERLLIILKLKLEKQMILFIWKGSDVREENEDDAEDDLDAEDLKTRSKIANLLKQYGIDRRSKLIFIRQGYEPPELIKALGGKLLLRKGDRFDSVYQRNQSSVLICKSFEISNKSRHNHHQQQKINPNTERVVVIEEDILDPSHHQVSPLNHGSILCSGYAGILKFFHESRGTFSLFIWNGRYSNSIEVEACRSLAHQIRNEVTPLKMEIEELDEGNESQNFLAIFGKSNFAKSYHWRYKSLVPMMTMITDSRGEMKERISGAEVSIIYTGLEIYVIVPCNKNSKPSRMRSKEEQIQTSLKLAHSISESSSNLATMVKRDRDEGKKRRLAVHALIFPSVIPLDLLASVRFSTDLQRLNDGFGIVDKMNLINGFHEYLNNA